MKFMYTPQGRGFIISCLFLLFSFNTLAQVGIGNTNPNNDALLEIGDATTTTKGLLLPRVNLVNTSNFAPMTAHVQGMVVYNKNTAGDVTPGYYYNDGSQWVRIASASVPSNDWTLTGNAGTTAGTNFLGTTDDVSLRIRTNNTDRFDFSTNGRLRSYNNGSANQPTYSWASDTDIGMYRIGANNLGFSTNGTERVRISGNGNVGIATGANATERLEVTGNLRLNGAFMPGNDAGMGNRVLTSAGTGASPVWGADMGNVNGIHRYVTSPGIDINANTNNSITVTVPGLTTGATAIVNIQGNWSAAIYDDITIHNIEVRTGEVRFSITNNTGLWGVDYPGMIFNVTVIR